MYNTLNTQKMAPVYNIDLFLGCLLFYVLY